MSDTEVEVTNEELDAELAERVKGEIEAEKIRRARVNNMVSAMTGLLGQFEASNSEAIGAAFTLAYQLTNSALAIDPTAAPQLIEMAQRLLLTAADPRPADAHVQITPDAPVEVPPAS